MALPVVAALAGASLIGGGMQAYGQYKSAQEAARAQRKAAEANKAYAEEILKKQQDLESQSGYGAVGTQNLNNLNALIQSGELYKGYGDYTDELGFDASTVDVTQDPGYAFRLSQGQKALDTGAGAKGQLFSGAQQKALAKYGQELGSQEYQNAYQRQFTNFQDTRNAKYQDYLNRVQQYNQNLRNQVSDMGNMVGYGENSLVRQQNALSNSVGAVTGAQSAIGNANAVQNGAGWSSLSSAGSSLGGAALDAAKLYAMGQGSTPAAAGTGSTGTSLYGK
jgi:hypothetical protein